MLFDKAKVVKSAEKYLSLGKIPAAIKEYEQLVANDSEDLTALNMLGDLHVRVGNKQEAITCFLRIAEHYREEDFSLKAIAMYKKVDRLQPGDPVIAEKLATLYGLQGLVVEARAQYMIVAESWTRAGESRKALEVLRKIADLDPENTDVRIKLAEGYLNEGIKPEAADAFVVAGEHLLARRKTDRALEVYSRALEINPQGITILSGILAAHAAQGTADEAAEIIERALAESPGEVALLDLLARAYLAAEDAPGAERATANLIAKDPATYLRFVDVAHLYLKIDDLDSAVNVVARITEQMLASHEENSLLDLVNEALARDPEHVQALRLLVRVHWWQRDMEKLQATLERLLEAAQAAELVEDERYALTQLTRIVPDQQEYFARLQELGGALEESTDEARPAFQPDEVPTFDSFQIITGEISQTAEPEPAAPAPVVETFEWNTVPDAEPVTDEGGSFTDLEQPWATPEEGLTTPADDGEMDSQGFQEIDFESVVAAEIPAEQSATKDGKPPHQAELRQELESVDFYINQGYSDIALDTLDLLQKQFGPSPDIEARREQLKNIPVPAAEAPATVFQTPAKQPEPEPAPPVEIKKTETPRVAQTASSVHPAFAEMLDEFRTAAEDEGPRVTEADYETHFNLGLAYKDLYMQDEALEEFQIAAALVRPRDGTSRYLQCCNMLGHTFLAKGLPKLAVMWFKKGLEAPGHSEEEYQALRFDLGGAYEDMGDLDKAIEVFTEVYGVNISYRGVRERLQQLQARKSAENQETPAVR